MKTDAALVAFGPEKPIFITTFLIFNTKSIIYDTNFIIYNTNGEVSLRQSALCGKKHTESAAKQSNT